MGLSHNCQVMGNETAMGSVYVVEPPRSVDDCMLVTTRPEFGPVMGVT